MHDTTQNWTAKRALRLRPKIKNAATASKHALSSFYYQQQAIRDRPNSAIPAATLFVTVEFYLLVKFNDFGTSKLQTKDYGWRVANAKVMIYDTIRYDTIRDAILTCARKPTWLGLIYPTETTTKNCKTEKLKSKSRYVRSNSKSLGNRVVSSEEEKERLRWEGFAEKEGPV